MRLISRWLTAGLLVVASLGVGSLVQASPGTVAGLIPSAGQWTASDGIIDATDLNQTTNLVNQYAYQVNHYPNPTLLSVEFNIGALPQSGKYTVGLVDHSAANGNGQYKWSLDVTNQGLELINDGFQVVSRIPYKVPLHRWVSMELLVSDNVLDGRVWTGSKPPAGWQITGRFFRGLARTQPDAGLYAAHADVQFRQFQIHPLQTVVTADPTAAAGMYPASDPPSYVIHVENGENRPLNLSLVGQVVDADGQHWTVRRAIHIARAHSQSFNARLPVSHLGWYGVQYNLINQDTGQVLESLPQMGLALIPPALNPGSTRIGMNISVVSWYLSPKVRQQDIALEFSTLADQGVRSVRLEFDTNLLPDWSIYDPMMAAAHHHGMQVLGILNSWPTGKNPFDPADHITFAAAVKAYEAGVRQIVERYRPGGLLAQAHGWGAYGITDWEIWNEPSIPSRWGGSMTQYGELVKATAATVRAIEPKAFLLEYAHDDKTVYQASGDVFNGLAIHYYPGKPAPENTTFPITNAVFHNLSFLHQAGLPPILWMTEVGWNTQWVSPIQQAEYLVRASFESLSAGSGPVYLFIQNFLNSGMGDQHLNFTPKPAFSAVLTAIRMIRGYHPDLIWSHGNYSGEVWTNGKDLRLMVWNDKTGRVTVSSPTIAGLQKVNWMDDVESAKTLLVSAEPTYLTVPSQGQALSHLKRWFNQL